MSPRIDIKLSPRKNKYPRYWQLTFRFLTDGSGVKRDIIVMRDNFVFFKFWHFYLQICPQTRLKTHTGKLTFRFLTDGSGVKRDIIIMQEDSVFVQIVKCYK